jgi:hypothetical protein
VTGVAVVPIVAAQAADALESSRKAVAVVFINRISVTCAGVPGPLTPSVRPTPDVADTVNRMLQSHVYLVLAARENAMPVLISVLVAEVPVSALR